MDVRTNSFCAGGNVLGDGRWLNVGGNQAVGPGGLNVAVDSNPYANGDGGMAVRCVDFSRGREGKLTSRGRTLTVCDDETCNWNDDGTDYMTTRRWYPTLETLEDGTMIIVRYLVLGRKQQLTLWGLADGWLRLGRIRQRRRTEQPHLRVLPLAWRSHRPQDPHHDSPCQPLPPHLAPSFRCVASFSGSPNLPAHFAPIRSQATSLCKPTSGLRFLTTRTTSSTRSPTSLMPSGSSPPPFSSLVLADRLLLAGPTPAPLRLPCFLSPPLTTGPPPSCSCVVFLPAFPPRSS